MRFERHVGSETLSKGKRAARRARLKSVTSGPCRPRAAGLVRQRKTGSRTISLKLLKLIVTQSRQQTAWHRAHFRSGKQHTNVEQKLHTRASEKHRMQWDFEHSEQATWGFSKWLTSQTYSIIGNSRGRFDMSKTAKTNESVQSSLLADVSKNAMLLDPIFGDCTFSAVTLARSNWVPKNEKKTNNLFICWRDCMWCSTTSALSNWNLLITVVEGFTESVRFGNERALREVDVKIYNTVVKTIRGEEHESVMVVVHCKVNDFRHARDGVGFACVFF